MLYFEYRNELSMDEILSRLDDMLDDFVYKKIWESLSGKEREITLCIPEDEISSGDICEKLHMTSSVFSKYRERLIKKGIIVSTRHGYIVSILPHFSKIAAGYASYL